MSSSSVAAASIHDSIGHLAAERTFKIQAGRLKLRAASRRAGGLADLMS
jgi:hypothetical protein